MAKREQNNPAYKLAVAASCARTLLLALGCPTSSFPDIGNVIDSPAHIVRPKPAPASPSGRFRRTDQEIAEFDALKTWQLARRNGASENFVIEVSESA